VTELTAAPLEDHQPLPVDDRPEWRRPQLRRMPALEAQKGSHGHDNAITTS